MRAKEFLTRNEKELLDEILRVSAALNIQTVALTGTQYQAYGLASKRKEFQELYWKRLKHIQIVSNETRPRYKKRDTKDMFVE